MTEKEQLIQQYSVVSKHSNYQILPKRLQEVVGDGIKVRTRYEHERLQYMLDNVDFVDRSVLDIGGNTGYFTFELVEAGASRAVCYEGNKEHSEFVRLAAKTVGLDKKIGVVNGYFGFDDSNTDEFDIVLLLNVLHHVGDDYGELGLGVEEAKEKILEQLNSVAEWCSILVFQLGFNWQGDVTKPLFEHGTKQELIDFVINGTKQHWEVQNIGIAEKHNGEVAYKDLDEHNIERDDSLGEFLNRPLFIMRARR